MSACTNLSSDQYQRFEQSGYLLWDKHQYAISDADQLASSIKSTFQRDLALDASAGSRWRAYLKLIWHRESDAVEVAADQRYFQSAAANNMDGGKPRVFKGIDPALLQDPVFQKVLADNKAFIRDYEPLAEHQSLVFGIHFVRYLAEPGAISYSSPVWLHVDDEPLVFVHLIDLSQQAIGGDNIVANLDGELLSAVRLQNFFDTMVLNRNIKHAVTPLGAVKQTAHRDIILFTVEPDSTNHLAM